MGVEDRVLWVGGFAGLATGALLVIAVIIRGAAAGAPFGAGLEEQLQQFHEASVLAVFQLVNGLSLVAYLLSLALFLAIYRSLRVTSSEYALGGLLLYVVFVALYGVFTSWTFFVHPRLAELYFTTANQATIVEMFGVTHAITDTISFVGSLFFALSALTLGAIMLGNRDYGGAYGGVSLVLGLVGIVLLALLIGAALTGPSLLIVFAFLFGWKVYSLSKAP